MVSRIEPCPFEDHLGGCDDFAQCFLAAFRADSERRIIKELMTLELHTTRFTAIGINRHTFSLLFNQQSIIARPGSESKGKPVRRPLTDAAIEIYDDLSILTG